MSGGYSDGPGWRETNRGHHLALASGGALPSGGLAIELNIVVSIRERTDQIYRYLILFVYSVV